MNKHDESIIYALNEQGDLVHVDSVPTGIDCGCSCPFCRETLIAKNSGAIQAHHFAHISGSNCRYGYETILHLLAKDRIKEAFDSLEHFFIEFSYRSCCPEYKTCKYSLVKAGRKCFIPSIRRFDLKEYYDSCEQEIAYNTTRRRSDLKIFSKKFPSRPPVYIEFCVTHASDRVKLHSKERIIEVKIEAYKDLEYLVEMGFGERKKDDDGPQIAFFGFNREDYLQRSSQEISFWRLILYQSGKVYLSPEQCSCTDVKRTKPNAAAEVLFNISNDEDFRPDIQQSCLIVFEKLGITSCIACKHCKMVRSRTKTLVPKDPFCCHKNQSISLDEGFKCPNFKPCIKNPFFYGDNVVTVL